MASLVPEAPIPIALEVQAMALSTSELEVMQWLESIGFERYQPNFVANDVFSFAVVREIESVTDLYRSRYSKALCKSFDETR